MSMHRSLKTQAGALNEYRNVLTRAERITRLTEEDRFKFDDDSPLNLPKVANRAVSTGKKKKSKEEGEETAEGEGADTTATTEETKDS